MKDPTMSPVSKQRGFKALKRTAASRSEHRSTIARHKRGSPYRAKGSKY